MPHTIAFENDGSGVRLGFSGHVRGEEILEATRAMYAADRAHRLRYQIVDFLQVEKMQIGEEQLRTIALLDQAAARDSPDQVVALVGTDLIFAGAEKRYAIYAEVWAGFESQLFGTLAEARAWIAQKCGMPDADAA